MKYSKKAPPCPRTAVWLGLAAVLSVTLGLLSPPPAHAEDDDPALWPAEQVEFFYDGPALLVPRDEREEVGELDKDERGAWIQEFLDRDPDPETPENELLEGIERRRRLVRSEFITMLDHRARVIFLHGPPDMRQEVECGATFNPLEIWHYGERQLVFYQGRIGRPYRLWHPFDSKRALYNQDMAYWLVQLAELGMKKRRIDIKACKDARLVDDATGVEALRGFRDDRPQNADIAFYLAPPQDLAAWSRRAAATPIDALPPTIAADSVELTFPERRSQRMLTRVMITLPADVELETFTEEDKTEYRLVVVGVVEQDGQLFDEFRVRFKLPPPEGDTALALAFDRALRPERSFVIRFRLEDELGNGQLYVSRGFTVPDEPEAQEELAVPADVAVTIGEEMSINRIAGTDSLLLVPPENDLVLGLWRADVLVTGERIQKVVFLVDGEPQLTRGSAPFTAEVRLARYPREQIIRVEGYDADDELVAYDEASINQPRGSFKVRIVEPRQGVVSSGTVAALAEVVIPEDRRIEKVQFLLNNELVREATQAPWNATLEVPDDGQTAYLSVTAILDDGSQSEDVRFLNSPQYLEEVEVNFVELLTTVLDNDRRPVAGLAETDFTVLEDGRPQELAKFELVENLPLSVGITIDTSGSMAMLLPEAQRAAVEFLHKVITPRDQAFAVSFSKEPVLLIPPTDDVGAVEAALDDLRSLGWTALHDAVVSSLYYFRGLGGRRALILLSDGNDSASFYPFRDAVEFARRSGVVIYTVGLNVGAFQTEIRKKLNVLAKETGGRSFFIDKAGDLSNVYSEIERELRSQYLLAYSSDAPVSASDEFRAVEVKVKGGRKARTIAGYYP
jgi:VWFA-related protein